MSFRRYVLFYVKSISEIGKEGYLRQMKERLPNFYKDYAYVSGFATGFCFVSYFPGMCFIFAYTRVEPNWTFLLKDGPLFSLQVGILHPIAFVKLCSLVVTGVVNRKEILEIYNSEMTKLTEKY